MRLYRALLRLLPRSFRDDYGGELAATFERRLAGVDGPLRRLALWTRELAGLAGTALREHGALTVQDLRWAARSLRRAPAFALTAIGVAALGIGATTASFSVTDHVLVRDLPFPQAARLVKLWQTDPRRGYARLEASPAHFREWRELQRSFESIA
ncbi:MAG: hypothetical protein NDJ75_09640, partial [Thermoanaerobaculia bacterium]|nr:hypothetical protein [Thermoanaerobaculia bacterium]